MQLPFWGLRYRPRHAQPRSCRPVDVDFVPQCDKIILNVDQAVFEQVKNQSAEGGGAAVSVGGVSTVEPFDGQFFQIDVISVFDDSLGA